MFRKVIRIVRLKKKNEVVLVFDLVTSNRPRFPEYNQECGRFCFETRTIQGRGMKIDVYNSMKNTNYIYMTSIEDLIRDADEVIREVNELFFNENFCHCIRFILVQI